jgi:mersacidin/lichenicidin family type 2 lantibiotic
MSKTIRAWKDEEYRLSLDEVIESPVGSLELTDMELDVVAGGGCRTTIGNCRTTIGRCGNTVGRCNVSLCLGSFSQS